MPDNALFITMGVAPSSDARLRDALGRWMKANEAGRQYTEMQLGLAVARFTQALRVAFAEGHDKYGRSHDKTGYTIRTLHIVIVGMSAVVEMGGGAVFVRYGWERGPITAKPGGVLTFVDQDGVRVFRKSVKGAMYAGDDFPARAAGRVDVSDLLLRIAHMTYYDVIGHAADARGNQYTGGQMFRAPLGALIR